MGLISFFKEAGEKIFGLDTKDIQVEVDGDQVVLKGSAKDQETLEKAALQVGNKAGIASVKTDDVKI